MAQKKVLLIGGTGILGKAIISEALKEKIEITVIGLSIDNSIPKEVIQIVANRKDKTNFEEIVDKLNKKEKNWDLVLDIADWDRQDAEQTYNLFKNYSRHFFIISTTLVYDRSNPDNQPIKENHPLAKKGALGGYVDNKLDIENFWQSIKDANWTILRPYHIIGPTGSLLGCIPEHNRDPNLIESIKKGDILILCNGGNYIVDTVDARDIGKVILKASGNKKTFFKAYNVINPNHKTAKEYYEIIGKALGKEIKIKSKSIKDIWKENKGWQLTTLPHKYDVSDLRKDIGFVPEISLEQSIKEALKNYKPITLSISQIKVHQRMTLLPRPKPIRWLIESEK